MDFIRKSIVAKITVSLVFVFLCVMALAYSAHSFVPEDLQKFQLPALLFIFLCSGIFIYIKMVKIPFQSVFEQMKALLTGHSYKKIITSRIDEVGVLAHFFNEVTRNIEKISVDLAEGKRLSQEVSVAADIQARILPKELPIVSGMTFYGKTRPASEVGGDSFDVINVGNNMFAYVGDVTGHGLPAALIMVMVNTILRTYSETFTSGYDIIVNTNRILKQRIEPRRFMTCVLLRWNIQEQKLYFTGAGHEHILIFHKKEGVCEVRKTGGIALGMVADISKIVKEEQISLEPEDYVVLYSDGIIEAKNMRGEMFGIDRLKTEVEQYARISTPEELFTHIFTDFGAFVGQQIQEDDMTLMAFQRK